jgi:hypothetical protein
MRKLWNRLGLASAVALLATGSGAVGGCASEQPTINQVQEGYIRKADLVGADSAKPNEWYMRQTITDTRKSNPFAFVGMQDEMQRIRWDVQEKFLIARLAYELVSGSDGAGADPTKNSGQIVAVFGIQSHFDVQRAYNTSTGEEYNILVENTVDKPWYQREYMRVDWSRNMISDPGFEYLWFPEVFGELKWESPAYYQTDPKSPDAPVFDLANGYMDVSQRWLANTEDFNDWGFPKCYLINWLTGSEVTDCNDQDLTVRLSFKKVADTDYEAGETDSSKWQMFGTFNKDRYGFDRNYEITDKNWHRLMSRHNLWQKSHDDRACMNDGKTTKAAADATCGSVVGSVCDAYAQKCTLPLNKRAVKTIPYYVSRNMPADLWQANQELIDEWNVGLNGAVAAGREVECRRSTGEKSGGSCHTSNWDGEKPKTEARTLVLCHNPVVDGDDASCGAKGTIAREGDLRFNLIAWVDMPQAAGPLGFGPDGADPLTGEVVQATAYIYGASLDNYAAMTRDLVALADGDLKPEDFIVGNHLRTNLGTFTSTATPVDAQTVKAAQTYGDYVRGVLPNKYDNGMDAAELKARMAGIQPSEFVAKLGVSAAQLASAPSASARLQMVNDAIAAKGVGGEKGFGGLDEAQVVANAAVARLQKSPAMGDIQAAMPTGFADLTNSPATEQQVQAMQHATSATGPLSPMALSQLRNRVHATLEQHGMCMFGMDEFNAPQIEGLARKFKDKYKSLDSGARQDAIFKDLRYTIYKGVTEHEVGHTMSLRHNFQGSWDSLNYHPNYWYLRTANGTKTAACTGDASNHDATTDTCMGPRYLDPITQAESGTTGAAGTASHVDIHEFAYSSIMDYGYDFNSDLHGIGSYDMAAMRFIYTGVVDVFKDPNSATAKALAPINSSPITEQWMVYRNDPAVPGGAQVQPTHYTTMARLAMATKDVFDPSLCVAAEDGKAFDAVDGKVCGRPAKDFAHVSEMASGNLDGIDSTINAPYWKSQCPAGAKCSGDAGRIRWPYRYGTDEYASYVHTLRFDSGADIYEGAVNVSKLYEFRYVLDYWRRGRRGWQWFFLGSRLWDRYFSRFHSLGWMSTNRAAQYAAMYPGTDPTTNPALKSDDWGRPYALALTTLFDTLTRVTLRPQPGNYDKKVAQAGQKADMYEVPSFGAGTGFGLGVLTGRYIDDDLSQELGGSFHYSEFMQRMGIYDEKPLASAALAVMFPPIHTFSRDTYTDGRNMLLNYRTLMPQAYDRLFGGLLAGDVDAMAPWVDQAGPKDSAGNLTTVLYPNFWDANYKRTGTSPALVDPLVGFKFQIPAMFYTAYYGCEDSSEAYFNKMRIWVEGGVEGFSLPDNEKVFFFEPESGLTWAARDFGDDKTPAGDAMPAGIGARILRRANFHLAKAYKVKVDVSGYPVYDAATHRPLDPTGAVPTKPYEVADQAELANLRLWVGNLNVLRNMVQWFGQGPLN